MANHKGTIVFRGVSRYSEDILTATEYNAETMSKGVKAFILENPGDEHVLQNGDIIVRTGIHLDRTNADDASPATRPQDDGAHPSMRDGDRLSDSRSGRVDDRKASS